MIHMRNVGQNHILVLDTHNDESRVLDRKNEQMFVRFNSSSYGFNAQGEQICRLSIKDNHWIANNDLGIQTQPVSFDKRDGIFELEAEFSLKWLESQNIETT
jgi:hypothetical protein